MIPAFLKEGRACTFVHQFVNFGLFFNSSSSNPIKFNRAKVHVKIASAKEYWFPGKEKFINLVSRKKIGIGNFTKHFFLSDGNFRLGLYKYKCIVQKVNIEDV